MSILIDPYPASRPLGDTNKSKQELELEGIGAALRAYAELNGNLWDLEWPSKLQNMGVTRERMNLSRAELEKLLGKLSFK